LDVHDQVTSGRLEAVACIRHQVAIGLHRLIGVVDDGIVEPSRKPATEHINEGGERAGGHSWNSLAWMAALVLPWRMNLAAAAVAVLQV